MLDDNLVSAIVLIVGYFVSLTCGALIADAYWRLWGRARFEQRMATDVDAEITRQEAELKKRSWSGGQAAGDE